MSICPYWCTNITAEDSADEVEVTGFKEVYKEFLPGLKDSTITATFVQDMARAVPMRPSAPLYLNNLPGPSRSSRIPAGPSSTRRSASSIIGPVSGGPGDAEQHRRDVPQLRDGRPDARHRLAALLT